MAPALVGRFETEPKVSNLDQTATAKLCTKVLGSGHEAAHAEHK
jgi:hypothetical protein